LQLLEALRAGRVAPGASSAALAQHRLPADWATPLAELAARGWTGPLLGEAAETVAAERASAATQGIRVVSTQPGAAHGDLVQTSVALRQLFTQAKREILLAGFRVTDRSILEHLRRPPERALDVRLFFDLHPKVDVHGRTREGSPDLDMLPGLWMQEFLEKIWPPGVASPRAWYSPLTLEPDEHGAWRSMHIKTVVVDRERLFVTSANFTDRAQTRNFELGVLVENADAASRVVRHFEALVSQTVFAHLPVVG